MRGVHLTQAPYQQIVRRTADATPITADDTLNADDTLKWSVGANEVWFFEAWLLVSAANATMDVQYGWTFPTGTTMKWGAVSGGTAVSGYGAVTTGGTPVAMLVQTQARSLGTVSGTIGHQLAGIVTVGSTAGTMNLTWAQSTSDAGELNILANSFLRLTRLP